MAKRHSSTSYFDTIANIRAETEARNRLLLHNSINVSAQMMQDALFMACHEVFQMSVGRAERLSLSFHHWWEEIIVAIINDDDVEALQVKQRIDDNLRAMVPADKFASWEERYPNAIDIDCIPVIRGVLKAAPAEEEEKK